MCTERRNLLQNNVGSKNRTSYLLSLVSTGYSQNKGIHFLLSEFFNQSQLSISQLSICLSFVTFLPILYTLFFYFREKFLLTKRCRFHCSWKLVALSLTVLTLILSSVIAYFGGKIFYLYFTKVDTKGQKQSKLFFHADVSSKKRTNKFYFTTVHETSGRLVFVCFLEEFELQIFPKSWTSCKSVD